jgi:hypothetical protein
VAASKLSRGIDRVKRALGMHVTKRGEIVNDSFSDALVSFASDPAVKSILEIGSSTGEGSTQALLKGVRANPSNPQLFCVEALTDRFELLQQRCREVPRVSCFNVSSVSPDEVESEDLVRRFSATCPRCASLQDLLTWRQWELNYVRDHQIETSGIRMIRQTAGIDLFDMVLLDGSEFTGRAELDAVYGAGIIALDDVMVLKNHFNLVRLT